MDSYTCNCEYFPLISYCKHLAAIQLLFPEDVDVWPFPSLTIKSDEKSTMSSPGDSESVKSTRNNDDISAAAMACLSNKLQQLSVCTCLAPSLPRTPSFMHLESLLDLVLVKTTFTSIYILPKTIHVALNQHSWTETAAVMHQPVKSK